MLYNMVLTLHSVDEVLPRVAVKLLVEVGCNLLTRVKHLTLPAFCCLSRAS